MTEGARLSIFELHKRWTKLENEHHQLAAIMTQAEIGEAPANTLEDYLALLDVALEHEIDLAADIAYYGAKDYPMLTRLLRILVETAPGFEFNSLRRWLSSRGKYEQLMGRRAPNAGRRG